MDSITIYEFLREKSITPTGPGSYSNSKEMSNALKALEKNNSSKTKGKKDVNFYDYDGSLVNSYSAEEFLQLSEMPKNPSHEGLTAQGWNYTFSDAKNYVTNCGKLNIGQMYITNDGKTRLHIKLEEGRLKPRLGLGINGSVVVDWGDNSQTDIMTGSDLITAVYQEHEYSVPGEYTISIAVTTGKIALLGGRSTVVTTRIGIVEFYGSQVLTKTGGDIQTKQVYLNSIKSIELGNSIEIGYEMLSNCYSLTNITIPDGVTSISNAAFRHCYSLTNITIPSSVTNIGRDAFSNCYSLTNITIPDGVMSIEQGAFGDCHSLTNITIPSSVTNIGRDAFFGCSSLTNITIPSSVTSIEQGAFGDCHSLTNITIPSSVTNIGGNAFFGCYGLGFIKFEGSTPATVSKADAWSGIPTDCIIYVPQGSLSAYTSASNYPSSSTYTYIQY